MVDIVEESRKLEHTRFRSTLQSNKPLCSRMLPFYCRLITSRWSRWQQLVKIQCICGSQHCYIDCCFTILCLKKNVTLKYELTKIYLFLGSNSKSWCSSRGSFINFKYKWSYLILYCGVYRYILHNICMQRGGSHCYKSF